MQSKIARILLVLASLSLAGICLKGTTNATAQGAAGSHAASPSEPVAWDALQKEVTVQATNKVEFVFSLTNVSDHQVIITDARGSCHCTVAKLPMQPWPLAPHADGQIKVTVDLLAAKFGTIFKTVTVLYSNASPTILRVTIHLPDNPTMARSRNQQMASADRQLVFKADCAKCHADTARDKTGRELMGKELYGAVCGVCHEANPRATMVSDLHALNHPTNYEYWRQWITNGKQGTLMPAFAASQGGPLSDKQIESLAKLLTKALPTPAGQLAPAATPAAKPSTAARSISSN